MKVLQVIPTLAAGGAESFVTNLGLGLVEYGFEVKYFLLAGVRGQRGKVLHERLRRVGVDVVGTEERRTASLANLITLMRLIRSWKPDIVQANLYAAEVACALAKTMSFNDSVCFIRRLANTKMCGSRPSWVLRMLHRFFRLHIACSPSVATAYCHFTGESTSRKLVTIVNGGQLADAVPNVKEKAKARQALGLSGAAFVVTHIGSMLGKGKSLNKGLETGQKGHDVLLNAFRQAYRGDPNCILLCVGDGPLRVEAESLARHLGLRKQVRFLGQVPEPWPPLLAADVFCFPSRHEGMPNVLPEAASCGLPVVASDIPEIRSIYPGGAWILEPVNDVPMFAQALLTVRNQIDTFRQKAIETAPAFRRQFSMKTCTEQYIKAYELAQC